VKRRVRTFALASVVNVNLPLKKKRSEVVTAEVRVAVDPKAILRAEPGGDEKRQQERHREPPARRPGPLST
jgi:hypothetical protein